MGALKELFMKELDKFNKGHYRHLTLHPEVIMNEVDAPYTPHSTSTGVIAYLVHYQADRLPQLVPDLDPAKLVESPASLSGATHGQLSGSGTYQDNSIPYDDPPGMTHPASKPFPVRFIFNFKLESGIWLIINATAWRS
jgi:hypothetical protein